MKQRIKSTLVYIFQPKLIIFCLALYNFISLWTASNFDFRGIACVACPWYYEWSYLNEPSLLFLSAVFLLFSKWWSNIISFLLSSFVLIKHISLITRFGGWFEWLESVSRRWQSVQEYEIEILKEWEIQLILAVIVFGFSIFYLMRNSFYKNAVEVRFE